jgi:outer membrane protein OmpA-like peptidoglycan-associated protein
MEMRKTKLFAAALALVAVPALITGCATKKYVKGETDAVNSRVDAVEGSVEKAQTRLDDHDRRLDDNVKATQAVGKTAQEASRTAQEALQRAQEAGKLAEGKFLYETALSDDKVKFGFNASDLSPEAKAALDEFAATLKTQNKSVYIEIQGHTDNVGKPSYNEELGLERAEAVRRYLSQQHGLPLHRINVISYGEDAPVADNGTREGRSQNRRVVLVVLQ